MELWLTAILSAIFAGVTAIVVTRLIEKLGGVVGGILGTTPTTVIPASIGLYYSTSSETSVDRAAFSKAMLSIPAGLLLNALFLYSWKKFPACIPARLSFDQRLAAMVSSSLLLWFSLAVLLVTLLQSIAASVQVMTAIGITGMSIQLVLGVAITWHLPAAPAGSKPVSPLVLLARSIVAGLSIGTAVALGSISTFASGVASCFPAIFLTSMVAVWISQGEAVQGGAVGPMVLGSLSVSVFAILAAVLFPATGPWVGCLICWSMAVVSVSVAVFFFLRWRRSQTLPAIAQESHGTETEIDIRIVNLPAFTKLQENVNVDGRDDENADNVEYRKGIQESMDANANANANGNRPSQS